MLAKDSMCARQTGEAMRTGLPGSMGSIHWGYTRDVHGTTARAEKCPAALEFSLLSATFAAGQNDDSQFSSQTIGYEQFK